MGTYSASKLFSLCKPFLGLLVFFLFCRQTLRILEIVAKREADIENYYKSNFSM